MYRVFRNIPHKVRQQAFELLVANKYGSHSQGSAYLDDALFKQAEVYLPTDNEGSRPFCPLGAANIMLGVRPRMISRMYSYSTICMPDGGSQASGILLRGAGIEVNSCDAGRFIEDNDRGKFDTREKLATAMGVTIRKKENKHESA